VTGAKIRKAVRMAAKLAGKVSDLLTGLSTLQGPEREVLVAALSYHFKTEANDAANVATIQQNFGKVCKGLSALVCIADIDHPTSPHAGYVPVMTIEVYEQRHGRDLGLSPFASAARGLTPTNLETEQDVVTTSIHVLIGFVVQEKARGPVPPASFSERLRLLPAVHRRFLMAVGIFGVGAFAHTLLILLATQRLTPRMGAAAAASAAVAPYVLHNVFCACFSYLGGLLADHFPKNLLLSGGYALAGLMALGIVFLPSSHWITGSRLCARRSSGSY
jgi:hypothetical protein